MKTSPVPFLLRQELGIQKGATTAGRETVAVVTDEILTKIAQIKLQDLNTDDLEMAKRQVAGTARSMGISVEA